MENLKPTSKEIKAIDSARLSIFSLLISIIAIGILVFAKGPVEYRQPSASIVTKSLNTSYQLSLYRDAMVTYSVQISSSLTLSGGQSGTITLQTSPNNSTWTTISTQTNNNTGSLTIGLNTTNTQATSLTGFVPAGYYIKIVTSGTATMTWICGMEVLL